MERIVTSTAAALRWRLLITTAAVLRLPGACWDRSSTAIPVVSLVATSTFAVLVSVTAS